MSEINYPLWWLDPAYCPWAQDEYYDGDESLIDACIQDDDDHFYVTNYGYPVHQGSM